MFPSNEGSTTPGEECPRPPRHPLVHWGRSGWSARRLLDALPQLVWVMLPDRRVVDGNAAWRELVGAQGDEPPGLLEVLAHAHPDDVRRVHQAWRRVIRHSRPQAIEVRLRAGARSPWRWHHVQGVPDLDPEGRVRAVVLTALDIHTQLRRREHARFLDEAGRGFGATRDLRQAVALLFRLAIPKLAERAAVELFGEGGVTLVADALLAPASGRLVEHLRNGSSLKPFYVSPGLSVLSSGKVHLDNDVPQSLSLGRYPLPETRAVLEAARIQAWLALPLEVGGRRFGVVHLAYTTPKRRFSASEWRLARRFVFHAAAAMDQAQRYEESQDAVRVRDERLSVASHELRGPLMPMHLSLDNLRRELRTRGLPLEGTPLGHRLEVLERQQRRLGELIEDLLDVTRPREPPEPAPRPWTSLGTLTRRALELLEPQAQRTGSEITLEADPSVGGNWEPRQIGQVITNLLTNALKYGRGRPIRILVDAADGLARLRVEDEGIGIAPGQLAGVFERYHRAVPHGSYEGLGLGLSIVRGLVEAHGGTVSVESARGLGSRFTVLLPRQPRPPEAPGTSGMSGAPLH